MTQSDKQKVYQQLAAPFPESCIQRSEGRITGRGYDTTGIGYQYVVNRMNEVLGLGGWRVHRTIRTKAVTTSKGRPAYEAVAEVTIELGTWVDGQFVAWADAVADGGHIGANEADSIKAAYSGAIKKCCAFFGVAKAAYEGSLDDDNVPQDIGGGFTMSVLPTAPQRPSSPPPPAPPPAPAQRPAPANTRNRLTSKQLSAIWALGRRLGHEQQALRQFVKGKFGSQPEFLSREQASQLIGAMSEQAGNGRAEEQPEPGEAG